MTEEICRQLARENSANNWKFEDLRRTINREIGILEAGTMHRDAGINNYVATASFHTGARQQAVNQTPDLNHYQPISSDTAVLQCVHSNVFLPDKDVLLKTAIATVT